MDGVQDTIISYLMRVDPSRESGGLGGQTSVRNKKVGAEDGVFDAAN